MANLLQIDSSARLQGSLSREITQYLAAQLAAKTGEGIVHRDLSKTDLSFVTEAHIGAYYTRPEARTEAQKQLLTVSDELIAELKSASHLIIGAPMYNFSVTAALKAWIDLVCRVGETFVYGEKGAEGLLTIKNAYIVVAAGGTAIGSEADFSSPYLTRVCHFIGINNVHIIDVSGSKRDPDTLIDVAKQQVDAVLS
jgi:FMN-dependent NADH-azoreductase